MSEFEEWWKIQKGISLSLSDVHEMCAKKAWNHQQSKIEELEGLLREALPYLKDHYDGYYGEMPVTKLAIKIKERLEEKE